MLHDHMSGHSHWAGIKHKKAITDAKRANVFTKFGRAISIASREGGSNPETNWKLKLAIDQAKSVNMPKENIERAIKRGTGELKGETVEEVIYEAYLPVQQAGGSGQVAMLIKTATDNKNRTLGELKNILTKAGGKLVPAGSVSYLFKQVGNINIPVGADEDPYELELKAIEAGAEDIIYSGGTLTVFTKSEELQKVKEHLEKHKVSIENAGLVFAPLQKISLDQDTKLDYEKLLEALDNQDDVQEIFDNL
ncbi:MAG: YebC/PmpR family DNA-binding transcriptional regulator [Candidatus Moranbacteria bacterium]|nr:YebC/PmpR family DNA-binding transcriptional regulator [Candidatus Moranbacteria bacterium]